MLHRIHAIVLLLMSTTWIIFRLYINYIRIHIYIYIYNTYNNDNNAITILSRDHTGRLGSDTGRTVRR